MNVLTTVISTLFAWTVLTLALSWLLSLSYPFFKTWLQPKTHASTAAFCTLLYSLSPSISAIIALLLLFQPEFSQLVIADHCHGELCTPHTLHISMSTFMGLGVVTFAIVLLIIAMLLLSQQLLNKHRHFNALQQLSEPQSDIYHIIESPNLFAWCAGLWYPKVYVSRGLLKRLDAQQLQIVLNHELSHARRRDNLRRWILHWASMTWYKKNKLRIRKDFKNYSEQVCDFEAVLPTKNTIDLETAVKLIGDHCLNKHSSSINDKTRKQRIAMLQQALRSHHEHSSRYLKHIKPFITLCGLWLTLIITSVSVGHPLLEWLSQ